MSCHWDNKIKTRTTVKQFLKKTPPKDKFMPTYCKKKKKKKKKWRNEAKQGAVAVECNKTH